RIVQTVHDSKVMTRPAREAALTVIQESACSIGIGMVESFEIDQLGMTAANRLAMERAVYGLSCDADALLLDAFVTDLGMPQVGLIDGDARCLSISAASIVAKVTRDRIMCELHEVDSRYGLDRHVGYGTRMHLGALRAFGPAPFHRRSFRPVQACLIVE
ncbi:MAG: ribonuclease HII, partial [Thermomicrobiales bacterium]|nr:ribonuclease HII [Thermomicrobiales bacterium]